MPVAGDVPVFDLNSGTGTCTVTAGAVGRRLECSGVGAGAYAGTIAFTNQLTLGDGVNGSYTFVAGMTVSGTAGIKLVNTVAAGTNLTSAGKALGPIEFAGVGGSWTMADAHTVSLGTGQITLTNGTLNTNGQTVSCTIFDLNNSNTRTLTLGASSITCSSTAGAWNATTVTGLTFNANTSTITLSGAGAQFQGGALTYNNVTFTGSGTMSIFGANTFANFTRTGTAGQNDWLSINANQTVTGTLTLNGNSVTNRLLIRGAGTTGSSGQVRTITSATNAITNADFEDITGAGAASWNLAAITGNSGDCGGNSGITFTTAATQTWSGTSGGNWSANAWTSRVPLPQDDVVINAAFSASQTITVDMPRNGKNVDFTGVTGSPALTFNAITGVGNFVFGSLTLAAGLGTVTINNGLGLGGRSSHTLTTAGKSLTGAGVLQVVCGSTAGSGTYTLQDDLTITAISGLQVTSGTLTANGKNLTSPTYTLLQFLTATVPTVNMGTGTWSITSTAAGTPWNVGTTATLTLNASTSVIVISNASTNTRTFAGGGQTYATLTYTVAGSTGQLTITGANTFDTLNFSDASNARTLVLPASTTTTISTTFNVNGTSGKLMSINSSSAGTAATLSKASGLVWVDFGSIKDSTATGGATFRATNSTNVSGNTGWTFGALTPSASISDTAAATDALTRAVVAARALADSAPATEAATRALTAARATADTAAATDALTRAFAGTRALADTAAAVDAFTRAAVYARALADLAPASEAVVSVRGPARALADSAPATEALTRQVTAARALAESAPAIEALTRAFTVPRAFADSAPATDALTRTTSRGRALADSALAVEALTRLVSAARALADLAPAVDSLSRTVVSGLQTRAIADNAPALDSIGWFRNFIGPTTADVEITLGNLPETGTTATVDASSLVASVP